ncbi:hypothetical protein TI39_contig5841g00008 [Zymoseptoria brevis]|uniref:Uncharacterized protein n=1 Tax=Zymoseptoria brevis TaxID=1047168 RepID=A0A0F4G593_9PEZI|nr:hypothetical protein TI39_contig5841g00008 [Zymoseptoria brevis]
MRALTPTAGLQHDIEHLQKLPRTRLPMDYRKELRAVLSFAKGPFQLMNESSQQDHFRDRPQRLIAWQDVEHLARLTTEDKENINALQVQEGLRITDWEIE